MENMTSPGTLLSGDNATGLKSTTRPVAYAGTTPGRLAAFFLSPELTVQSVSGDNNVSGATLKNRLR